MTNVTSEIIAGIDKPGNRGKGGLAGSHEVASHQGRIKEGLAGRPVGKGWERAATEEEGQHRSNRPRVVWELTSRNFQAPVTDRRTRLGSARWNSTVQSADCDEFFDLRAARSEKIGEKSEIAECFRVRCFVSGSSQIAAVSFGSEIGHVREIKPRPKSATRSKLRLPYEIFAVSLSLQLSTVIPTRVTRRT